MSTQAKPQSEVSGPLFGLLCLGSYLLSLSYGATFLLSLLISGRGGDEHDAGRVIAAAMLSTFVAVIDFPWLAGRIIVEAGIQALLLSVLAIAVLNWLISLARLGWRHLQTPQVPHGG